MFRKKTWIVTEGNFIQTIKGQLLEMYHHSQNHNAAETISAQKFLVFLFKVTLHMIFYEGREGINTVSPCGDPI